MKRRPRVHACADGLPYRSDRYLRILDGSALRDIDGIPERGAFQAARPSA